jgi:hypothetical protein
MPKVAKDDILERMAHAVLTVEMRRAMTEGKATPYLSYESAGRRCFVPLDFRDFLSITRDIGTPGNWQSLAQSLGPPFFAVAVTIQGQRRCQHRLAEERRSWPESVSSLLRLHGPGYIVIYTETSIPILADRAEDLGEHALVSIAFNRLNVVGLSVPVYWNRLGWVSRFGQIKAVDTAVAWRLAADWYRRVYGPSRS